MVGLVFADTMKRCDEATIKSGVRGSELMGRVAEGVAKEIDWKCGKIAVVCGKGNNGGDGYALALMLEKQGYDVTVFSFGDSISADARYYQGLYGDRTLRVAEDTDFSLYANIVDCIFGVGLNRALTGEYRETVIRINKSKSYVISIDIPSGINSDNGQVMGVAVQADVTIAVQNFKVGHFYADGLDYCGEIGALDIGIKVDLPDVFLADDTEIRGLFPPLRRNIHKGTMGKLTIIGGSEEFSGAAVLAEQGASAFALGAGLVKLAVPDCILYPVMNKILESTLLSLPSENGHIKMDEEIAAKAVGGADAVVAGNGIGVSTDTARLINYLVQNVTVPLILDADALNILSACPEILRDRTGATIITPHAAEMARLMHLPLSEIKAEPFSYAKEFAARYGVIVLLKGASTLITDGVKVVLSVTGSSGMAKGGSGDVLAGAIGALTAAGRHPFISAVGGAYVCGLAGEAAEEDKGAYSTTASVTAQKIGAVVKRLSCPLQNTVDDNQS